VPEKRLHLRLQAVAWTATFALSALALGAPAAAIDNSFEMGPGGVRVPVRLTERLSSQDAQAGQRFAFETTAPVTIDGAQVAVGTPGVGLVLYVRSGRGPQPGEMRLSARALHLTDGKTIAVGLEPQEAATARASDTAHASGLSFPTPVGTLVFGGIARGNNVVYERGTRFTLLAPPPATPEPEPT